MNCPTTKSPFASNVLRAIVFSIAPYIGLLTAISIIPLLTLIISTKSVSSVVVSAYLLSVSAIFNLSAPVEFSFDVPCELSSNDWSVVELINDSVIVRPILYEGLPLYFSSKTSCAGTLTKNPLIKITPSEIFAIEARPLGLSASVFALTDNSFLFAVTCAGVPSTPSVTS